MKNTVERIPVFASPTGSGISVGSSVIWRAVTHRGLVRLHNEDAFCTEFKERCSLFSIADGLGGHRGGAIASELAIDAVKNEFKNWSGKNIQRFVSKAILNANQAVFNTAQSFPELSKMQTTATVVAFDNHSLAIGHVGDCRFYRVRNGRLALLTRDHTVASDLLRLHLISPAESSKHPGRYQLTRSVGANPFLRIDLIKENVNPGDAYLLCSDGVWSNVTHDRVRDALLEGEIDKSLEQLIEIALESGAQDNITAIVMRAY